MFRAFTQFGKDAEDGRNMSVQAGIWNFGGEPIQRTLLEQISATAAAYGPDGETTYFDGPMGMLHRPFHTTSESRLEQQPYVSSSGRVTTWDGRLDNRVQLIPQLLGVLAGDNTDVAIVAAALDSWGTDCFAKFRGDWAVATWHPKDRQLILARDYLGVKPLFYYLRPERLSWCSHLAALALCGDHFTVCDEYVAGYLAFYPDAHLTPYKEIQSVAPGAFVSFREGQAKTRRYWTFNTRLRIHHETDAEYEEQYRHLLRQAVRRRLRTDSPTLADLSGGFDSSSIVCMADDILAKEGAETPTLDTFSFYDLNEPDEDDLRHLSKVEQKRGRKGFHVDLGACSSSSPFDHPSFTASPHFDDRGAAAALPRILEEGGHRVLLTGTGGDEVNGQALDPRIVMADLFLQFRWIELSKQLTTWSLLIRRRPGLHLLFQALLQLAPSSVRANFTVQGKLAPFVNRAFARKHKISARQIEAAPSTLFLRPGVRDALQTVATLSRRVANAQPSLLEKRYPYLDQDLVEFLTAIPLEQLQRSGERRFLMRRAIGSILPQEVLTRTTKSRIGRCYCLLVQTHWARLVSSFSDPLSTHLGYIDRERLYQSLLRLKNGQVPTYSLGALRAVALEVWLSDASSRGVISIPGLLPRDGSDSVPSVVIKSRKEVKHNGIQQAGNYDTR